MFKLKDYFKLSINGGVLISNVYKPYINYDWSNTFQVANKMYSKNIGTSGQDLELFSGQGCWFNGIDQNIVLETVPPSTSSQIWTICFNVNTASTGKYIIRTIGDVLKVLWFNGGLTYYNGSTNIKLDTTNISRPGSYVVSSDGNNIYTYLNNVLISTVTQNSENLAFGTIREIGGIITSVSTLYLGVIKDVYYFRKNITETERSNYFNQPNQFFIDSLEDDSCITAMPMCEKDGFVRNYKSYSEGSNLVINGDFSSGLSNWSVLNVDETHTIEIVNNELSFNLGSTSVLTQIKQNINIISGKIYILEYEITKYTSGSLKIDVLGGNLILATTIGKHRVCFIGANSPFLTIYRNSAGVIMSLDNFSIREVKSIYPITNYLSTCRTNAQRLPYGLQTSGFKRDSNGLILSKSNFLECDGVGYYNTGWVPKSNEDFTVETVLEMSNDLAFRINGNNYVNGVYFGEHTTGNNLYVRVFGSGVTSITNSKNIVCLTFSYNWQSKEVKQYVDGIFNNTQLATQTTNSTLPVLLGMVGAFATDNYPLIKPIRLFKVHAKVLTQEEITKNFNKYQSQGLLNE